MKNYRKRVAFVNFTRIQIGRMILGRVLINGYPNKEHFGRVGSREQIVKEGWGFWKGC